MVNLKDMTYQEMKRLKQREADLQAEFHIRHVKTMSLQNLPPVSTNTSKKLKKSKQKCEKSNIVGNNMA